MAKKPATAKPKRMMPRGRPWEKGETGNPFGRPPKEKIAPATALESVASVTARVLANKIAVQDGNGSREVCALEALFLTVVKGGLKDARLALRALEFAAANENNASSANEPKSETVVDLLEDPIVKRHLEREMRKRLHSEGESSAASGLLREQYGDSGDDNVSDDRGEE